MYKDLQDSKCYARFKNLWQTSSFLHQHGEKKDGVSHSHMTPTWGHGRPRCSTRSAGGVDHLISLQLLESLINNRIGLGLLQTWHPRQWQHRQVTRHRFHLIILTQIRRSFPTFALSGRHSWEAHIVIGSVLRGGVRHAGWRLRLRLLPIIARGLLPPSTHWLGGCFLRWAERWESSA